MKIFSSIAKCIIFLTYAFSFDAHAEEKLLDRVVAVVGGTPVLLSDVNEKVAKGPLVTISEYPASENDSPFEKALQDSINYELMLQKSKELEIDVKEEDVDKQIDEFLISRGLSRDGLYDFLRQEQKDFSDYRHDFRNQMLLRQFQGRVIRPFVRITDRDVELYFLKKTNNPSDLIEVRLRQILIKAPKSEISNTAVSDKEKIAQDVYRKLKNGMPFIDAVKIYSDPDAQANEGLMGSVKLKDLTIDLQAAIQITEPGTFTQPIQTSAGFYIMLVEERKILGGTEFQRQKSQLETELLNDEILVQTRRWLTEQRQRSSIDILSITSVVEPAKVK